MKLYNCLILNNEIWTLELRIKYDLEVFDYIILAESNKTFSGIDKPFYYEKYKFLFEEYEDRIIYCKIYDLPEPIEGNFLGYGMKPIQSNRWPAEHYMRHQFKKFIVKNTNDEDFIYFQDLDEIQNNERLSMHILEGHEDDIVYNASFNYKCTLTKILYPKTQYPGNAPWFKSFVTTTRVIKQIDVHDYRKLSPSRSTHKEISYNLAELNKSKPTYWTYHIADGLKHDDALMDNVYSRYIVPVQNILFKDLERGLHLSSMAAHINRDLKLSCFSHNEVEHKKLTSNEMEKETDLIIERYYGTKIKIKLDEPLVKNFSFIYNTKFGEIYV